MENRLRLAEIKFLAFVFFSYFWIELVTFVIEQVEWNTIGDSCKNIKLNYTNLSVYGSTIIFINVYFIKNI